MATIVGSFDHLEGSTDEFLGQMGSTGMLRGPKEVDGGPGGPMGPKGLSGRSHGRGLYLSRKPNFHLPPFLAQLISSCPLLGRNVSFHLLG